MKRNQRLSVWENCRRRWVRGRRTTVPSETLGHWESVPTLVATKVATRARRHLPEIWGSETDKMEINQRLPLSAARARESPQTRRPLSLRSYIYIDGSPCGASAFLVAQGVWCDGPKIITSLPPAGNSPLRPSECASGQSSLRHGCGTYLSRSLAPRLPRDGPLRRLYGELPIVVIAMMA